MKFNIQKARDDYQKEQGGSIAYYRRDPDDVFNWLAEDIDGSYEQNEDITYQRINRYLIEE